MTYYENNSKDRHFEELSKLTYSIKTVPFPNHKSRQALIVAFEGEYGFGSRGNADATFINSIMAAAKIAWESSAILLDYSKMSYEWGDRLPLWVSQPKHTEEEKAVLRLFNTVPHVYATIVSSLNREGIVGLVEYENAEYHKHRKAPNPSRWLFDSVDAALIAIEAYWDGGWDDHAA